jgi:ubiquinone/menaquinone biosynthesis C-methylase UbiE
LVIANHVLFYPKNLHEALREIRRVLRPGGVLCCATYGQKHMREIRELVHEFDENISLSRVALYENFGLENGGEKLSEFFADISVSEYPDYLEIPEVEPLLDYIISCHGNQRERLEPRYEEFKTFLQKKIKQNGMLRITKQAGVFIARKE